MVGFQDKQIKLDRWKEHPRAGKFPKELEKFYIDKRASLSWLRNGRLGFYGEKDIIAAQDQGLVTNGLKRPLACQQIIHILQRCSRKPLSPNVSMPNSTLYSVLAGGLYTARQNRV